MEILIDLTSLADNLSGIERFALSITREMIKDGRNRYTLIFKNEIHKDFLEVDRRRVRRIVLRSENKLAAAQAKLPAVLLREKADIYFFPAFPAPFMFFDRHSVSAIFDLGCFDFPGTNKRYMTWYFRILYRKAALGDKKIVTVSDFSKRRIEDILKVRPESICTAHCGISREFTDAGAGGDASAKVRDRYHLPERYILCLSTIEPRKNIRLLVEAFSELFSAGRINEDLVLAGRKGWMTDTLFEGIPDRVREHIILSGFVDDEDLPYIYDNAGYFVFPSLYEGFGMPVTEAMSRGCIVLASDAAALPETAGDAALYFKSDDLKSLKAGMLRLESLSEEEKEGLRERGRERAEALRWEDAAEKILRFFEHQTG